MERAPRLGLVVAWSFVVLRRSFIRLYSRAQAALHATLAEPPAPHHETAPALPGLMREAKLNLITIAAASPGAGKLIGELGLRTTTGGEHRRHRAGRRKHRQSGPR